MKPSRIGALFCLLFVASQAQAATVAGLRCEYLENPLGLDTARPRLSWRLESERRGERQTACQILVASTPEALAHDQGDLWDSGKVAGDATLNVEYAGKPLASGQRACWKVRAWDGDATPSPWSPPASFGMGLLKAEDWKAQWISHRDTVPLPKDAKTLHLGPPRHYRKEFAAPRAIKRATVYAAALGIYDLYLNGRRVSDDYFQPGWSDTAKRAYTRACDVTEFIKQGDNAIGAIVADGWYAGYLGYALLCGYGPNKLGRYLYGKTPALLAQLEIEYANGTRETIVTDPSWQVTAQGPIREADFLMGESYDARAELPGWAAPGFQAKGWEHAIAAGANGSLKAAFFEPGGKSREVELGFQRPPRLQAYSAPPIRVTQELKAQRLSEPKPGVYIFDMGQNFAGNIRLEVQGPTGTKVQIRYGEMLHPDGRLMTENLRRARAIDSYILRGDPAGETWTPRFTYHGFQYVELSGLPAKPQLDAVTGLVIHNDTPLAGAFECSDPVMTQFARNAQWTQRSNFIEVPTDCPQRDERLGWMGDAQVYVRTASYFADVSAFFTKWLDDLEEAQRPGGAYPDYCPYPMAHGKPGATHGTAWTDAGIICPWTTWLVYGDTRLVERHWDSMQRFMAWRRQADPELRGVELGNTWGDWLNVNETTPIPYIDLCYHALDARLMKQMAEAIGRQDDATKYQKLWDEAGASFRKLHLKSDGLLDVDTQSAYVLALWVGLIPDDVAARSAQRLADKIRKNDNLMATGFLGTRSLLGVLTRYGQHELAVRLFENRRFPSWGYEVVNGATSVWERWDSYTKEFGFNGASGKQNAGMNSFNHYSFGAVMEWAFRDLAGIDTAGAGYPRLVMSPGFSEAAAPEAKPLTWVKARYDHPRGRIASEWRAEEGRFEWHVTVPANTTARLYVPAKDAKGVTESGRPAASAEGVKFQCQEGASAVFEVGAGDYRFSSKIK